MVNYVGNLFTTLLHFIVRIFKRAICCLRRRRRPSCEPIPLTNVGVIPNVETINPDLQNWNNWDDTPTIVTDYAGKPLDPIKQQIEMYRQQKALKPGDPDNPEENVDFFEDMKPRITRQTKILLQKETDSFLNKSNYSLAPDPAFNSSELGVWEENQSWEDQAQQDWDADEIIKEKKRLDRERRAAEQHRKKIERDVRGGRQIVGTRIS